jgi:hypothetical protein
MEHDTIFSMLRIPLHCLVLTTARANGFAGHEYLSRRTILYDLVGDSERADLHGIVYQELRHRIELKLSLGERVVLLTDDLSKADLEDLAARADKQGAHVLRIADESLVPVRPPTWYRLRADYQGITVIGDIHGDLTQLQEALEWARSRRHFAWLLGDILDYGVNTLACVEAVHQAVTHGYAGLILGNHERKIARWLDQKHIRVSDGNRVTIDALGQLKPDDRRRWINRFRALLAHASLMTQMADVTLIHAAVHPSLWTVPDQAAVEQYGLYGQGEINGKYHRVHHWVHEVPRGQTVLVGHNVISPLPLVITGKKGGQVVFLDTGCGKGGHLSTADLRFVEDGGLRLECFNRFGCQGKP